MTIAQPSPAVNVTPDRHRSNAPSFIAVIAVIILATILLLRMFGIIGHGSLSPFRGKVVTVYLRIDSDPRAGRSNYSSGSGYGVGSLEGVAVSVLGRITRVAADGITLKTQGGEVWVPLDRVQAVLAAEDQQNR